MLALKDNCLSASSQEPYIKSFSGGRNNSPEGHAVRQTCTRVGTELIVIYREHFHTVEFESEEDRDYYVQKDPAHQDFIKFAGPHIENVKVLDYEPGKL
jgi:hypothetical protein